MSASLDPAKTRVALLAGGVSGEREISLLSAKSAREALESAGFSVMTLDPANRDDLVTLVTGDFSVAFICLHGRWGEDGTIQGMLEILGLPYTGSGVCSSALAIDKAKSKIFYRKAGIPTPRSVSLTRNELYNAKALIDELGERCVVKPTCEGSTLGVHIVSGQEALESAIELVLKDDEELLVESYVPGIELTVSVIGNAEPEALPVIQIVPINEFYDFESKYAPGGSKHLCPAPIPEELTCRAQELAVAAHKALGCRGMSRSDILVDEEGACWVLETNTVPGMTATSLLPDAARVAGYDFPTLCTKLIEYAFEDLPSCHV